MIKKEVLMKVSHRLMEIAEESEKVQIAYARLCKDRGSSMKLLIGDYWKVALAHPDSQTNRGMDMVVLGLQKHLSERLEKLRAEVTALQSELDKAAGGV